MKKKFLLFMFLILVIPYNVMALSSTANYQLRGFWEFNYNGETHDSFNFQDPNNPTDIEVAVFCIEPGVKTNRNVNYVCNTNYTNKSVLCAVSKLRYENPNAYYNVTTGDPTDFKLAVARTIFDCVKSGDCHTKWCNGETTYTKNEELEGTIEISDVSSDFALSSDKKYFVTNPINVSYNGSIENYKLNLSGAPSDTIVTTNIDDTTGIDLESFHSANVLYIKIPVSSVNSNIDLTLNISATKNYDYTYVKTTATLCLPDVSTAQKIIVPNARFVTESKELSQADSVSFALNIDYAKMYISKKDITNVEELEGATIKISCENGYVEEFVSTKEEKELDILPMVGSICTLEEEIAPEGYEKVKSSLIFEIDENFNVKIIDKLSDLYFVDGNKIVIYNGLFPDTGVYTWIGIGIIGAGLITGGAVIILREYKKKKNR